MGRSQIRVEMSSLLYVGVGRNETELARIERSKKAWRKYEIIDTKKWNEVNGNGRK